MESAQRTSDRLTALLEEVRDGAVSPEEAVVYALTGELPAIVVDEPGERA